MKYFRTMSPSTCLSCPTAVSTNIGDVVKGTLGWSLSYFLASFYNDTPRSYIYSRQGKKKRKNNH